MNTAAVSATLASTPMNYRIAASDGKYVVKFSTSLSRDTFFLLNDLLQSLDQDATYSSARKGFVLGTDPSELLLNTIGVSAEVEKAMTSAADKISRRINTLTNRLKHLKQPRPVNTRKRREQQRDRDNEIERVRKDLSFFNYMHRCASTRPLTLNETRLLKDEFRRSLNWYYLGEISVSLNSSIPSWLANANISTIEELDTALEEYTSILSAIDPVIEKEHTETKLRKKIKDLLWRQSGDIQYTPSVVAAQMVQMAGIHGQSHVLEPSAGLAHIADEIRKETDHVDVCELLADHVEVLKLKGYNHVAWDFLEYSPSKQYDAIIMNPPFSNNKAGLHISHAYSMLKNGGRLVSIVPAYIPRNSTLHKFINDKPYMTYDIGNVFEFAQTPTNILILWKESSDDDTT